MAKTEATAVARIEDREAESQIVSPELLMIERLATNPAVNVETIERLIAMQERREDRDAEAQFWNAFTKMQGDLPTVGKAAKGHNSNYAKFEDIIDVVRPVLQEHGFALSFRQKPAEGGGIDITTILAHAGGHTESTSFPYRPDTSGKKNDIQAIGSAQSYGQRYGTIAILNITTRDLDDDGHRAGNPAETPKGYEEWAADMEAKADDGVAALQKAWKASAPAFKQHITKAEPRRWALMKNRAEQVQS